MELRFVSPELASLDDLDAEVLACAIWSDARPSHGVAGLADFRMAGRISGRHAQLVPADRAADILLACGGRRPEHDVWTLVETADGKQRITQHMIEERRRVRRVG
jgi:hypothetical protein